MIKQALLEAQNAWIYTVLGLVVFFVFFTGMLIYVMRMKKTELEALSHLPFETDGDCTHE